MENSKKETYDKFVKELTTLHWALMAGILLAGAVITMQFSQYEVYLNYNEDYMILLVPLLALGGVYLGKRLYDQKIVELQEVSDLNDKLQGYRAAALIKFSLVEGPALIAIVLAMFKENFFYIIIAIVLLIYFYTLKVSKEKIANELSINL